MPSTESHTHKLNNIGVVVTRPAHQAGHLCELIDQAGGRAIPFPVIAIAAVEQGEAVKVQLSHLDEYDLAIFISANAVNYCQQLLPDGLPTHLQLAVVGKATARQLQTSFSRQPDVVPEHGFNSEALLALPELQQVDGKRIMIMRGEGGRALLGDTLSERGAEVEYANLYRRIRPQVDAAVITQLVQHNRADIIVNTSGEGMENLFAMLGESNRQWLCSRTWVVVNQRLANLAREHGVTAEIRVTHEPSDEAILDCIAAWVHQH